MNHLTRAQKGELFIFSEAFLWSFFPIVTIFTFTGLPPLFSASLSTFAAAIFFAITLTIKKKWSDFKVISAWKYILLTTLIIGVAFYGLMFIGIQKTTAGDAGIMALMEVFYAIAILRLWKKEFMSKTHIIGAICMVLGAFFILFKGTLEVNTGNLIILLATALPPIGNYFAQKAREKVGSACILFIRSILSGFLLLLLAYMIEIGPLLSDIKSSLIFILINGFLLLGLSKILWIEAIHRIPITKAISLASIEPLFTLFFAYLLLNETPTIWQIGGLLPILIGVFLLTDFKHYSKVPLE